MPDRVDNVMHRFDQVMLILDSKNPRIDERDIAAWEMRYDLTLPGAYRSFLRKWNGGRPSHATFPISGFENNPRGSVQVFFGLHAVVRTSDLYGVMKEWVEAMDADPLVVPIACTDCGDYVCLDMMAGGSVVFWDHVPGWGRGQWSRDDLYEVAARSSRSLQDCVPMMRREQSTRSGDGAW